MSIEFVETETGQVVGTLDDDLHPDNGIAASVLAAKRQMGWSDEDIRQRLPGWTNGYYLARSA